MTDQMNGQHDPASDDVLGKKRKEKELRESPAARAEFVHEQVRKTEELVEAVASNIEQLLTSVANTIEVILTAAQEDYKSGDPNLIIRAEETFERMNKSMPQNWCDSGNLDLRTGIMKLRRALALDTRF